MNSTIFSSTWIFQWIKNPDRAIESRNPMQKRSQLFFPSIVVFWLLLFLSNSLISSGQKADTLKKRDSLPAATVDSLIKAQHSPRKAAVRSAIIPGWGQAYNNKIWKIPIIYAALGITGYIFVDNLNTYKELRFAYTAKYEASLPAYDSASSYPGPYRDSTKYHQMNPQYIPISKESLKQGRDQFRRYVDYAAVFFIIFWGLNVVDAVVDAHLKAFDISPDLSLKIKPSYNPIANSAGICLVFKFRH
jgi:uncharacterized protein DUF5683